MIIGLGIDSVDIARFAQWAHWPEKKLLRVFSTQEIAYCFQNSQKSAERFAVRFAAREALFKALTLAFPALKVPFLTLCKQAHVTFTPQGAVQLTIDAHFFAQHQIDSAQFSVLLSLSHSKQIASAVVIIEKLHV
jgi:phosphopantetheine--protein transferase-like protein